MNINEEGLFTLKDFEKLKLKTYLDGGGVPTIGYGHTGPEVKLGMVITEAQANDLLAKDLAKFEGAVNTLVRIPIMGNEFSALVLFAYNCGINALKNSTLLRKLNNNDRLGAAEEFARWNKDGGVEVAGLTRRRAAEKELFLKA